MATWQSRIAGIALCILAASAAMTAAKADGYSMRSAAVPCCGWNGLYVGLNAGYGFSAQNDSVIDTERTNTVFSTSAAFGDLDIGGAFGGVQVGYNLQVRPWVIGLEADLQGADISDSSHGVVNNFLPGGLNATVDTTHRVNWFGTLRPRIGYAFDNTLVYATGGLAWAETTHTMRFVDNFGFTAQDHTTNQRTGYVVGGGIEHMLSCCWSVKLEYQYIDLGSEHYTAPLLFTAGGGAATVFSESTDAKTDFHTVRLGINWKWDDRREAAAPLK